MKVKSIQFYDYRVFYAEKELDKQDYLIEVNASNLLLYGENGSGKTSFFRGVRDMIYQEDFTTHFKTPLLDEGYIEIAFDDNTTDKFDAAGNKATKPELINISKLNSFLSYKELLRTHLYEDSEINFFDLLIDKILREHNLPTLGRLQTAWNNLSTKNIEQEKTIIGSSVPEELSEDEAKEQIEKLEQDYKADVIKFNDELDELLRSINNDITKVLKYFNQGIEIKFTLEKLSADIITSPVIKANVEYAKTNLDSFHQFLNEARLSAIALSTYLTALKSNPTEGAIKFIFLDDVFLGLDLSNRLPLLDILKDEFSDWQIFLTTYDRHWFEVAKQHLDMNKWKFVEMYASNIENEFFERPLIVQSENYFSKADKYLKIGDYAASLNYLRKELEYQIKERLPEEVTRHYEGKPHTLEHLWKLMVERYSLSNAANLISEEIKQELKTVRFSLLNPQSHDNLSTPVYKYELKRTFNLIEKIQAIPIIRGVILLTTGMELIFKHPKLNYSLTLELIEDWRVDIYGNTKTHHYPNCILKHWQLNGNDYYNLHKNTFGNKPTNPIEDKFDKIRNNIVGYKLLQPLTERTFNSYTGFEDIWSIKELLDRCDNQKSDNWFTRIFKKGFLLFSVCKKTL
jgi:hypothetical protein